MDDERSFYFKIQEYNEKVKKSEGRTVQTFPGKILSTFHQSKDSIELPLVENPEALLELIESRRSISRRRSVSFPVLSAACNKRRRFARCRRRVKCPMLSSRFNSGCVVSEACKLGMRGAFSGKNPSSDELSLRRERGVVRRTRSGVVGSGKRPDMVSEGNQRKDVLRKIFRNNEVRYGEK